VATGTPQLLGAHREVQYKVPGGATVTVIQDPASVAAGGQVWLMGTDLETISAEQLILTGPYPASTAVDVSAWLVNPQPAAATRRVVQLPAATGVPPAGAPVPGRYTVRLEGTTGGGSSAAAFRTGEVPLSVAASVSPAGGPLLPSAPSYTVSGTGFVPGDMQVLLSTIGLSPAGGAAPGPGEYVVNQAGTALTLEPPAGLAAGTYQIRVRVAGIESDPALWLAVP